MQLKHLLILFAFFPLLAMGQIPTALDSAKHTPNSPGTISTPYYSGASASNMYIGGLVGGKWFGYFTQNNAFKAFNDTLSHGLNYFQIRGNNGLLNSASFYDYNDNHIHWQLSEFDSQALFKNGLQLLNDELTMPDPGYGSLGYLNNSLKSYRPNGALFTVADSAAVTKIFNNGLIDTNGHVTLGGTTTADVDIDASTHGFNIGADVNYSWDFEGDSDGLTGSTVGMSAGNNSTNEYALFDALNNAFIIQYNNAENKIFGIYSRGQNGGTLKDDVYNHGLMGDKYFHRNGGSLAYAQNGLVDSVAKAKADSVKGTLPAALTLTTTGNSGAATLVSNVLNVPNYTLSGLGGISGSGTTNSIPKFTGASSIGNSLIFDNGTNIGIGTTSPSAKLHSLSTTEQLRLGYDATHYTSFTTSSTGILTISPTANSTIITGTIFATAISNNSGNNSLVTVSNTGTNISRNIADANAALIVNQANASSTGNIQTWELGGISKASINTSGVVTLPVYNTTGIIHNSSSGVLSTSLIANGDINPATIGFDKIQNFSTGGKILGSNTSGVQAVELTLGSGLSESGSNVVVDTTTITSLAHFNGKIGTGVATALTGKLGLHATADNSLGWNGALINSGSPSTIGGLLGFDPTNNDYRLMPAAIIKPFLGYYTAGDSPSFANGTFTSTLSTQSIITNGISEIRNSSAGTDLKQYDNLVNPANGSLTFRVLNDAGTVENNWMVVNRTGATPTGINFGAPINVIGSITQIVTSSLLKANSSGTLVGAVANTDYLTPSYAGFQPLENQRLSTTDAPTFSDIETTGSVHLDNGIVGNNAGYLSIIGHAGVDFYTNDGPSRPLILSGNNATATGTLTAQNYYTTSGTPTVSLGASTTVGTGATVSIAGTNQDGVITLITGTLPTDGTGLMFTFTMSGSFAYPHLCTPVLQFEFNGTASNNLVVGTLSSTGFSAYTNILLLASTTYRWTYHNGGY